METRRTAADFHIRGYSDANGKLQGSWLRKSGLGGSVNCSSDWLEIRVMQSTVQGLSV